MLATGCVVTSGEKVRAANRVPLASAEQALEERFHITAVFYGGDQTMRRITCRLLPSCLRSLGFEHGDGICLLTEEHSYTQCWDGEGRYGFVAIDMGGNTNTMRLESEASCDRLRQLALSQALRSMTEKDVDHFRESEAALLAGPRYYTPAPWGRRQGRQLEGLLRQRSLPPTDIAVVMALREAWEYTYREFRSLMIVRELASRLRKGDSRRTTRLLLGSPAITGSILKWTVWIYGPNQFESLLCYFDGDKLAYVSEVSGVLK